MDFAALPPNPPLMLTLAEINMGSKKYRKRICYLCGNPGADSKDHVPPKGLLPPGSNYYQRITVYAHRACNSNESADEEYLRDLLIPEAIQYEMKGAEETYKKVWRSWSKPAGWKRYNEFMKNAFPIKTKTSSGIYTGKAVAVVPDRKRILSVARKIVKGIIFHDARAITKDDDMSLAILTIAEALEAREKDGHEPYWVALNSDACKHTMFADHIAIRRLYQGRGYEKGVVIEAHLAVMIWNMFVAASVLFPLKEVGNNKFQFVIDTASGEWVRGEG
jgi:hypothetical protein